MASPVRNILAGSVFAGLLAVLLATPTIAGISSWKIVLAAVGVILLLLSYGRGAETK
jgi:ABC-type Fe3+-siderophore transport system permease subunit